jgi:hypothetical protein
MTGQAKRRGTYEQRVAEGKAADEDALKEFLQDQKDADVEAWQMIKLYLEKERSIPQGVTGAW